MTKQRNGLGCRGCRVKFTGLILLHVESVALMYKHRNLRPEKVDWIFPSLQKEYPLSFDIDDVAFAGNGGVVTPIVLQCYVNELIPPFLFSLLSRSTLSGEWQAIILESVQFMMEAIMTT